ncbi:hypothetical protein K2Y11_00495 [bacterium]|nr:hypothetical protein [bacterium]
MADFAQGWLPYEQRTRDQHQASHEAIAAMPRFGIKGAKESSVGKRVVLWEAEKKVLGRFVPTLHQLQGSCVEQGKTNAIMRVQCVEIAKGDREEFKIPSLYHGYGWTRKFSGMGEGRGDGATGAGAAKAAREAGVCPIDGSSELPAPQIKRNDGQDELIWGEYNEWKYSTVRAVPESANQVARIHVIRTTALVSTYEEVRDALVNGYPVTVASNRGFKMAGTINRGKLWGVKSGVWNHQMCFIGVDDDSARPGCYCMNSWGPWVHGKPVDDAPPGGFWVDADVVEDMVSQQDSFAYSQFDGFPEQRLDFSLIG